MTTWTGSRLRSVFTTLPVAFVAGALALGGCAVSPAAPPPAPVTTPAPADPIAGLVAEPVRPGAVSPALIDVVATRIEAPVERAMKVYREPVDAGAAITVSVVTYPDAKGARILYNGYFAERAFLAAAERRALALGDEAELVELPWPPLFTAYARQGPRFVLVEAAPGLRPPERRRAALTALLRTTLSEAAGFGAADHGARETMP